MKYRSEYNLGYRMGCGTGEAVSIKNKENWYALAACVLTDLSPDKSMRIFDLLEATSYQKVSICRYKSLSNFIYFLNKVCKVKQSEIAGMLNVSQHAVSLSMKYRKERTDDLRVLREDINQLC